VDRPPRPILCLVTDRGTARGSLEDAVAAALAGGTDWVQVRERDLEGAALLALVDRLVILARREGGGGTADAGDGERDPAGGREGDPERRGGARAPAPGGSTARVLVNRRLDVALVAGADGVHLGFDAVPPEAARRLLGPETPSDGRGADRRAGAALRPGTLVGVSCHSPAEVERAAAAGADYAHLAPIFDPFSKDRERPALGLEALARAARAGIPVLAQGGIDAARARAALAAGAAGVAVTGAVLGAADPRAAAAELRRALGAERFARAGLRPHRTMRSPDS